MGRYPVNVNLDEIVDISRLTYVGNA